MNSHMCGSAHGKSQRWMIEIAFALFTFLLISPSITAQPALNLKRIVSNWPTVELYFSVTCQGQFAYNMSSQNFEVFENGKQVDSITLWCSDPTAKHAISLAMVFDVSSSMNGAPLAAARNAGLNMVANMDGTIDEACIVAFESTVSMVQTMTTSKTLLNQAISGLQSGTMTACWDGCYAGLQEVVRAGTNPCRAVILLSDGDDNLSSHTPSQIITLATHNRIRVFAIGLGNVSTGELQTIAESTGGVYYNAPTPAQLNQIYQDILTILRQGFQECLITYEAHCMDGANHDVELILKDFCGGSDTKSKSYVAPKDTSTFADLNIRLGTGQSCAGREVAIPLYLDTPLNGEILYPASIQLCITNPACGVHFNRIETPAGSLLEGVPITVIPSGDTISIETAQGKSITGAGMLALLVFKADDVTNPCVSEITLAQWKFKKGCFRPITASGRILNVPVLTASYVGSPSFCEGDSLVLTASSGFASYQWMPGGTTGRSLVVRQSGSYTVTGYTAGGVSCVSSPVLITVSPIPAPIITPSGPTTICAGQSVTLDAGAGYKAYWWSNGATTRTITVDTSDTYSVTVVNDGGCPRTSPPVTVTVTSVNVTVAASGSLLLCGGSTVVLDAGAGYANYHWTYGETSRTITVNRAGTYAVSVTTFDGCTGQSPDVVVTSSTSLQPVISSSAANPLCPGDSVVLDAGQWYASYSWSTGETSQKITVRQSGSYTVNVTSTYGCTGASQPYSVSFRPLPVISPSGPIRICEGNSVTLDAGGLYAGYKWSTGATTQTIDVSQPGSYTVTVTVGDCSMTSAPVAVDVVAPPLPSIIPSTASICEGDTVELDAGAGYISYSWTTGALTRKIRVMNSGTYSVTVTDSNGCTGSSDAVTVTVAPRPPKPTITRSGDVLTASASARYQWYKSGVPIPGETNQSLVVTSTGRYSVEIWQDAQGCSAISDVYDVVSSVEEVAKGFRLGVYPEPNQGIVTIQLTAPGMHRVEISIADFLGRNVTIPSRHYFVDALSRTIDMSGLAKGVYFLCIQGDGINYRKAITRQ